MGAVDEVLPLYVSAEGAICSTYSMSKMALARFSGVGAALAVGGNSGYWCCPGY